MNSLFPEVDKEIEKIMAERERKIARIRLKTTPWQPSMMAAADDFDKEYCARCGKDDPAGSCMTRAELSTGKSIDIVANDRTGEVYCLREKSVNLDSILEETI